LRNCMRERMRCIILSAEAASNTSAIVGKTPFSENLSDLV
jgi:hypothetical protein